MEPEAGSALRQVQAAVQLALSLEEYILANTMAFEVPVMAKDVC